MHGHAVAFGFPELCVQLTRGSCEASRLWEQTAASGQCSEGSFLTRLHLGSGLLVSFFFFFFLNLLAWRNFPSGYGNFPFLICKLITAALPSLAHLIIHEPPSASYLKLIFSTVLETSV